MKSAGTLIGKAFRDIDTRLSYRQLRDMLCVVESYEHNPEMQRKAEVRFYVLTLQAILSCETLEEAKRLASLSMWHDMPQWYMDAPED